MVQQVKSAPQAVAELRGKSPADAARDSHALGDMFNRAAGFALEVRDFSRKRDLDEADTNAALQYKEITDPVSSSKYTSASDLREFGLEEDFMYEMIPGPDGPVKVDRESIPNAEYMPHVTERTMNSIIEAQGDMIGWGADRDEWVNEKRRSLARVVGQQQIRAAEQILRNQAASDEEAIEALQQAGFHDMAIERAASFAVPEEREKQVRLAKTRAAVDQYNNALQSDDIPTMMEAKDEVTSDVRLTESQQTAFSNSLGAGINRVSSGQTKVRVQEWDQQIAYLDRVADEGDPSAPLAIAEFHDFLYANGRPDYVGKTWLASITAKWRTASTKRMDEDVHDMVTRHAAESPTSRALTDDARKSIDRVVEEELIPDANGNVFPESVQYAVDIAIGNGYLPQAFRGMFRGVNSPNSTLQQAQGALLAYDQFADKAPHLISTIGDDEHAFLTYLRVQGMGGVTDEAAFNTYKDTAQRITPEVADRRLNEANKEIAGTGQADALGAFRGLLESNDEFGEGFFESFVPFRSGGVGSSTALDMAFEANFRDHYIRYGNRDAAVQYGYEKAVGAFGTTEVNGAKQVFRRPPERVTGASTKEIQTDMSVWLTDNIETLPYPAEEFSLEENINTMYGENPSYGFVRVNDVGLPEPLITESGQYISYTPDVDRISLRRKKTADDAAAKEREHEMKIASGEATMRERRRSQEKIEKASARHNKLSEDARRKERDKQARIDRTRQEFVGRRADKIAREKQLIKMGANE